MEQPSAAGDEHPLLRAAALSSRIPQDLCGMPPDPEILRTLCRTDSPEPSTDEGNTVAPLGDLPAEQLYGMMTTASPWASSR